MAAGDAEHTATRMVGSTAASVPATAGVTTPPVVTYEEVPSFGTGEAPEQQEAYPSQATADNPYGVRRGRTMTEHSPCCDLRGTARPGA